MNYLEAEIDEAVIALKIAHRKLTAEDINKLISALTKKFFKFENTLLDPMEFNNISSEHNPNFWREIKDRIKKTDLTLMVFDTDYRAWKINNSHDLADILGETTGYPFWVTDSELTFLIHLDDHNWVISA
ncbi:hypothetical protein [Pseudomonas sp. 52 E 6]|uniref:hypothetical protein n=1 Tax=Pseudomonas sp. 52 E 6 TaxID=1844106 RepID=UPI000812B3D8|nr:hypothetical protein [Pseudomonas sp. 52 E 6]CRM77390.1 hypothetical protein [Pseudomonas sp. 52 E 6]